ncbi:uncharacterized protein LOC130903615 isoform X1 [Diorhabda carinulata]|uniref:uncharacterized protein LOC130903615 isoform X1 n=2 Tax=Diorhabda carinulata TaxID=1163345 RepID=UPI0025A04324|nr:uncharacterized protein LOC130903615 isoform X1 [Diorhabda carinulata]
MNVFCDMFCKRCTGRPSKYFIYTRNFTDGMKFKRVPSIYWILILLCIVMLFLADVFQMQYLTIQLTKPVINSVTFDDKSYTIYTPGCKIPYMDPFDQSIREYITSMKLPKCNEGKPPLFESNLTSIYVLNSSLSYYQLDDTTRLDCCYSPFFRQEPEGNESDNKIIVRDCRYFNDSVDIKEEFIQVTCKYDNTTIYEDTFAFVPIKNKIQAKSKSMKVLVIGLDAVSRLNLHRQMPKTVSYLKDIEAVELLGYNKVGDNTFPNLIPVLTGFSEKELVENCWPTTEDRFDNCTFIWDIYRDANHLTAYGEDSSWMGLFNYQRRGFKKQSTDYAYNYFNRYSESKIGNTKSMNVQDCEGGRFVFRDLLSYIKNFVITMVDNKLPYFGFFWGAALSHDILNKPKLGDEDYRNFFKELFENHYLDNTFVFFISDHGIRWGDIRQTFQGRMEERLPFVLAVLPKNFRKKYSLHYNNLKLNSKRLTTPFDLHETLLDILKLSWKLEDHHGSNRGISWFKEISPLRTCEDAGIESHWCTCQQSVEIPTNNSRVEKAAKAAVDHINGLLKGYAQCARLALNKISDARLMTHTSQINGSNMISDYMLTLDVSPSEAVFEVTVRYIEKAKTFEIIGTISRLNLYGKQSTCITDFHLKLYCYCENLL